MLTKPKVSRRGNTSVFPKAVLGGRATYSSNLECKLVSFSWVVCLFVCLFVSESQFGLSWDNLLFTIA